MSTHDLQSAATVEPVAVQDPVQVPLASVGDSCRPGEPLVPSTAPASNGSVGVHGAAPASSEYLEGVALPDGALPWAQGPAVEAAADLGVSVMLSMKYMSSMRYQMPAVHDAVEPGLYPILFALAQGESRISDIAAAVMSDVSTVSRQVRHLVAEGMVDKLADPQDRRARLIQLTPLGVGVMEKLRQVRTLWFLHLFQSWDVEDVEQFRRLMDRFVTQLEQGFVEASQSPHGMADVLIGDGSPGETQA